MRRISPVIGLVLLIIVAAGPSDANICAVDNTPAATLLFPFVVLDYNDFIGGERSLITITNTSSQSQITRITVWTDFGFPILNFNALFTGYDVLELDLAEVFFEGQLPVTVWTPHQTAEGVQDRGPMSHASTLNLSPGLSLAEPEPTNTLGNRCDPTNQAYPGLYVTPIPPGFLNLFQGYLQVSQTIPRFYSDDCSQPFGNPYTPSPTPWFQTRDPGSSTWFYVTVDVVDYCSKLAPNAQGYFAVDARFENVLVGDIVWSGPGYVAGAPAVHIEADTDLGAVVTSHPASPFPTSFYHRYAALNDGVSDYREPLPSAWSMRYQGIGTDFIGTSFLAWKGATSHANPPDLEAIGSLPYAPDELVATNCLAYTYYAWDKDENVVSVTTPAVEINELPLMTQRVDAEDFQMSGSEGWALFIWPPSNWTSAAAGSPDIWQTWMGATVDYPGMGRTYMPANPMANWGCFSDQVSQTYGVDYDYVGPGGYRVSPGVDSDRARRRVR